MKGCAPLCFALVIVLAFLSEAKVVSITTVYGDCRTKIRVEVSGFGEDFLVYRARIKCKNRCKYGTTSFKRDSCPEKCGVGVPPHPKCYLCYPDKKSHISRCRNLTDFLLESCQRDCDSVAAQDVNGKKRVSGGSGYATMMFPGEIRP